MNSEGDTPSTSDTAPSIFESFNARNLSPYQVAMRFIPPSHFDDLVLRRHSLVIGPRGSGKTTLLKMLQLPALAKWQHPQADHYRRVMDFSGIFVAADVSWGAQLEALGQRKLPQETTRLLGLSAFTTHVLIAFIDAMRYCTSQELRGVPALEHQYADLPKEEEAVLVGQLAHNWKASPLAPSLHGLKLALRNRLSEIAEVARREAGRAASHTLDSLDRYRYLLIGFLEAVVFGIEAFNELAKSPDKKWALLFDELEIAPRDIRQNLFMALRSTDQRLIFKLSLSPYHEDAEVLKGSSSAMSGQDYQPIELWYPRKEAGYAFSASLLRSMLHEIGCDPVDPATIFGRSDFDAGDEDQALNRSAYRPGTRLHKRLRELAKRDESFRAYLRDNSVDLDSIHKLSETTRAGLVRKITSIVAVREAYRSKTPQKGNVVRSERSRKNPLLYTGSTSIFAIAEGNPRWFIGLIGPLLRQYREHRHAVDRRIQAREITTVANRFRALLRTIPYLPNATQSKRSRGLLSLLDGIGERFHENVVINEFTAEPVLSFTVDSGTAPELLQALGRALNAGAVILVPDEASDALLSSLRGKRFRLSYMLAPGYRLPLTLGRSASLSQILSNREHDASMLPWSNDE